MKEVNTYVTKDIIKNTTQLIELYNIIEQQIQQWGKCEVRILMKEVIDSNEKE